MSYTPTDPYHKEPALIDDAGNAARVNKPTIKVSGSTNIYRGFSTVGSFGRTFSVTDIELVKRDLLNHIYTIPGERIGNPKFGTVIPMITFEQITPELIALIKKEINKVIDSDPRVEALGISVSALPDNNAILVVVDLKYVELNGFVDSLSLTI